MIVPSPPPPIGYHTTSELACLYPVSGLSSPYEAWRRMLSNWRDLRKLVLGSDYRYEDGGERVYWEARVAFLVWESERVFCERVRMENQGRVLEMRTVYLETVGEKGWR